MRRDNIRAHPRKFRRTRNRSKSPDRSRTAASLRQTGVMNRAASESPQRAFATGPILHRFKADETDWRPQQNIANQKIKRGMRENMRAVIPQHDQFQTNGRVRDRHNVRDPLQHDVLVIQAMDLAGLMALPNC